MVGRDDRAWEQTFSDMVYWEWSGEPPDWAVLSAVGFMESTLELQPGMKVLDLGCALGYHSIELARRGYDVTGLEWSQTFLDTAKARTSEAGVDVRLVRGDMTRLEFDAEFDAVVLWGNTFGIFSDESNASTLAGIARALRPGGKALIDTQNYSTLPEHLGKGWRTGGEDCSLVMLSWDTRDILQGRFGFNVIAIDTRNGRRHEMPFSWRLYLVPELKKLVSDAGLKLIRIYGDDPAAVDWDNWQRGEPDPYKEEGFTDEASKRILLCEV